MNLALNAPTKLRFAGRSFLAFVLEPVPPVAEWLADLDALARQSMGFFANRPVVLDLSALGPSESETKAVLTKLKSRSIRVISVEGVDPAWVGAALAPLSGGIETSAVVDLSEDEDAAEPEAASDPPPPANESLLIEQPVRSGQSIFCPHGDVTVIGSVASGAEVVAGGNVHIYGALRGRAIAGAMGNVNARIFCRRFEAELVAIDGCYMTAEMAAPEVVRKPVQISLAETSLNINVLG